MNFSGFSVGVLQWHPGLAMTLAGVSGLVVGSFLNVVIARLPKMVDADLQEAGSATANVGADQRFDLAYPASHCPACRTPIRWSDNVPLISWLALAGECRHCGTPISTRYPMVEAATGALFIACIAALGVTSTAVFAMAFCAFCLALAVIDSETRLLPDALTLPLLWGGLLVNVFGFYVTTEDAILGAVVGYLGYWSLNALCRLWKGYNGIGGGDMKFAAAIGAWLGSSYLSLIVLAASATLIAASMARKIQGTDVHDGRYPFGPYLAFSAIAVLFIR